MRCRQSFTAATILVLTTFLALSDVRSMAQESKTQQALELTLPLGKRPKVREIR